LPRVPDFDETGVAPEQRSREVPDHLLVLIGKVFDRGLAVDAR
jgi:hypothetical protein